MAIRNAAKAVIVHDGKILLARYSGKDGSEYYTLPGGGQEQYEAMEETLVRECLEETGYSVEPVRFLALYEEIFEDKQIRETFSEYAHKIYHIFLCRLLDEEPSLVTEPDNGQTGCCWVAVEDVEHLNLVPAAVCRNLPEAIGATMPVYLGSDRK